MVKRVVVSRNAYIHIDRIIEFNNSRNQSTSYSKKFLIDFFKEINRLKKFPLMGIYTGKKGIFILVWADYYIYYTFIDDIVEIQSIYHQKENITR